MTNTTIYSLPQSIPIHPITTIYSSLFTLENLGGFTASNFNYAIKLYKDALNGGNTPANNPTFIAEFFTPPRPVYGYGVFSAAQYLQDDLYNPDYYINTSYTAASALENGPATTYKFMYGSSWDPELQIAAIQKVSTGLGFRIGFAFNENHGLTGGDTIFVSAEDSLISGERNVLNLGLFTQSFVIDVAWATPSVATGYITSAKRYNGTSSIFSAWNGTNQYDTRTRSYEYLLAGHFDTDPSGRTQKFLSTYYSPDYWTNTFIDVGDVITKTSNIWESIGFWADPPELTDITGGDLILNYEVFSTTASLMATYSFDIKNDGNDFRARYEVGVGFNNLATLGLILTGDEKYWDVYFTDSSDNSVISEVRRYVIPDECSSYEPVLVAWINRLGSLDYFTFTQNSKTTLNVNRNEWKKELGISVDYQQVDRGRSIISQKITRNIVLNSNWITEEEYSWLNELVTSPSVWFFANNPEGDLIPYPAIVVDTSYEFKKKLTEQIFNMTITLQASNDVWAQNQ